MYENKKECIQKITREFGKSKATVYRHLRKMQPKQLENNDIMENSLLEFIEESKKIDGKEVVYRKYSPHSYALWERFKNHKGNKIPDKFLPFFSYEDLDFPSTYPKFSPYSLMKTINPNTHKLIIPKNQWITIEIFGFEEKIRFLTKNNLLEIVDLLKLKDRFFCSDLKEERQEILNNICVDPVEKFNFVFPNRLDPLDFILSFIRFGTEVLSRSTSSYIEHLDTSTKYSMHQFYDFIYDFQEKNLIELGEFSYYCISAFPRLSIEYFKRFYNNGFSLKEIRK